MATTEDLLEELKSVEWFSSVGNPLIARIETRSVSTWKEAFQWTEHPVSWWCIVEGKKQLYEALATTHYGRFAKWNDLARAAFPQVLELIEKKVTPSFPIGVPIAKKAREYLQSQILGAMMELSYKDCISVKLFQDQIDLYKKGHFPCGWHVEAPEDFPQTATVMVF